MTEVPQEEAEVGPAALIAGLRGHGYAVEDAIPPALGLPAEFGFVRFPYTIKLGSLRGEIIPIGFVAPSDFPLTPPGGIYVRGDLRPISQSSDLPHGGVSDATQQLGHGWCYWSRAHDAWAESARDARAWMEHVDRLFLDL